VPWSALELVWLSSSLVSAPNENGVPRALAGFTDAVEGTDQLGEELVLQVYDCVWSFRL
jgi:hypothetical protein